MKTSEIVEHPTKREKIETLMKADPSLKFLDACLLLGYDPSDETLRWFEESMPFWSDPFNGL